MLNLIVLIFTSGVGYAFLPPVLHPPRHNPKIIGTKIAFAELVAIDPDIDRIALARKREDVLRPIAKENLKVATGGLTSAKLPKSQPAIDTRKESAKTAGVGERTYDAGKLVLKSWTSCPKNSLPPTY